MKSATLIIRDEVNVKFEGLDPATRRKISNSLKFMNVSINKIKSKKLQSLYLLSLSKNFLDVRKHNC